MTSGIVTHDCVNLQQGNVLKERKEHIFCPMCEVWHENSSWCQAAPAICLAEGMDMEVYL